MLGMGCMMVTVLKVKNNTNSKIDEIKFIYNSKENSNVKIKNIKPYENKQTGISTIYEVNEVRMIVGESDKPYLIKDKLPKSYMGTITIAINSIEDNNCEFIVQEGM
ncbi:MAG: hypothetical protein ACRDD7_08085 [Peptostreptococcaceae bacterium]